MTHTVVGTLAAAVGVLTAMPGAVPLLWCEMRGYSKDEQRGLVQPFIVSMQVVALALFALTPAGLPRDLPYQMALALPALILGTIVGTAAFRRVDASLFRRILLLTLIVSGLTMLR